MKIDEAKFMIRNTSLNFTEIAMLLNFNSIHYFSKLFKKYAGKTPNEFRKEVRPGIK